MKLFELLKLEHLVQERKFTDENFAKIKQQALKLQIVSSGDSEVRVVGNWLGTRRGQIALAAKIKFLPNSWWESSRIKGSTQLVSLFRTSSEV